MNREAWLTRYVVLLRPHFARAGLDLPRAIQVSVGFPSKGGLAPRARCVGECWEDDAGVTHIFVSPLLEADEIGGTLVHELLHAALPGDGHRARFQEGMRRLGLVGPPSESVPGAALADELESLEARLGPYPGTPLRPDAPPRPEGPADDRVIEKLRRLLALAKSDNVHEAAVAAAKAQELIERHRIDRALLEGDEKEKQPSGEPIVTTVLHRFDGTRVTTWILGLAAALGEANAVSIYYVTKDVAQIEGAGAERDLATVAYMLQYLVRAVERLLKDDVRRYRRANQTAPGRTWMNSFRNGAVATLGDRLNKATAEARKKLRAEASRSPEELYKEALAAKDVERLLALDRAPQAPRTTALAKLDAAIARVEAQADRVDGWVEENLNLRSGGRRSFGLDRDGYAAGRAAGERVSLSPRSPRITAD